MSTYASFPFGNPVQDLTLCSIFCLLSLLILGLFLSPSRFSWPWHFQGILIRYFVEYPSCICLMFLMIIPRYRFWGRRQERWRALLIASHQGLYAINIVYSWWFNPGHLGWWCLPGFSSVKLLYFPLCTLFVRTASPSRAHAGEGNWAPLSGRRTIKDFVDMCSKHRSHHFAGDTLCIWKYSVSPFRYSNFIIHLVFSFSLIPPFIILNCSERNICPSSFICLFIYSIIHSYECWLVDIYVSLGLYSVTIIICLLAQIVPTSAISITFWLTSVSFWCSTFLKKCSTSSITGNARCIRLIWYFPCQIHWMSHFSSNPYFLLLETEIEKLIPER